MPCHGSRSRRAGLRTDLFRLDGIRGARRECRSGASQFPSQHYIKTRFSRNPRKPRSPPAGPDLVFHLQVSEISRDRTSLVPPMIVLSIQSAVRLEKWSVTIACQPLRRLATTRSLVLREPMPGPILSPGLTDLKDHFLQSPFWYTHCSNRHREGFDSRVVSGSQCRAAYHDLTPADIAATCKELETDRR